MIATRFHAVYGDPGFTTRRSEKLNDNENDKTIIVCLGKFRRYTTKDTTAVGKYVRIRGDGASENAAVKSVYAERIVSGYNNWFPRENLIFNLPTPRPSDARSCSPRRVSSKTRSRRHRRRRDAVGRPKSSLSSSLGSLRPSLGLQGDKESSSTKFLKRKTFLFSGRPHLTHWNNRSYHGLAKLMKYIL